MRVTKSAEDVEIWGNTVSHTPFSNSEVGGAAEAILCNRVGHCS